MSNFKPYQALVKRDRHFTRMPRVYCILCLNNDYFYVGETVNISGRIASHKYNLRHARRGNASLQLEKFGESQFEFIVLHSGPAWQDVVVRRSYEQRLVAFCSKVNVTCYNQKQGTIKNRADIDLNQSLRKQTFRINKALKQHAEKRGLRFKKTQFMYAGLYTIVCLATGRTYYGESRDIHSRLAKHKHLLKATNS